MKCLFSYYSYLEMLVVLSVVVRQSDLHLFTDPLLEVIALTHELVELL